jgi:hypothetical protein
MTQESLFPLPQTERTSDDYWTPKWLFELMAIEFDLDVACPPDGPPNTPAKAWFTQQTDGLASPWFGRVWMNPPFSKGTPWVTKFIEHRNGVCLVPFSKSKWFERLWNDADALALPPIHMKFDQGGIFMPVVLAAYGQECVEAVARVGHVR